MNAADQLSASPLAPAVEINALDDITPLIITHNEETNIGRVLDKLRWAKRIVVIDSGSDDQTLSILAKYPQAEVIHRAFDTFAAQCNFGLEQVRTEWTLSLDADYVLSAALLSELATLDRRGGVAGFSAPFGYVVHGRRLHASLYPPRTVLYRTAGARYVDEGHGHRVRIDGEVRPLRGFIDHDDRKPLSRWFASQARYARREALHLDAAAPRDLRWTDRLRRLGWPAPLLVAPYTLFVKGCLLDGWRGWYYTLQRLVAEGMIAIELLELRLQRRSNSGSGER